MADPTGYKYQLLNADGTRSQQTVSNYLYAAGSGVDGVLGNDSTSNKSFPTQIGSYNYTDIAINYHVTAVRSDGTLWAWGGGGYYNDKGPLGNGSVSVSYSSPIQIGLLNNWKQVSNNDQCYTMAVKTDGTLWGWGNNQFGKLGNGSVSHYSSPIQIGSLTNWSQVSCGEAFISAVKTDGTLWTCGYNTNGQLGNGTTINYSSPIQVGTLTNWKQVSSGQVHTAAIKTDGTLWIWGFNQYGQLGNPAYYKVSSPIQVGSLTNWSSVCCLGNSIAAIKTDGTLWTWGYNVSGQLGNGTTDNYTSPIQVGSLTSWSKLPREGGGFAGFLAIKTDGTLWGWGDGSNGRLGIGNAISYSSPIQVGSLTNWKQVAIGIYASAVINARLENVPADLSDVMVPKDQFLTAGLWAWGFNRYGVLGNGNTINYSSPVQVGALSNWKQISCNSEWGLALQTNGTLWSWGYNGTGNLGNNTTSNNYSSPIQIGALSNWKQISTSFGSRSFSSAIKTDGTLWMWGQGEFGEMGNGSNGSLLAYSSPIQVGLLTNWKQVTCGDSQVVAVKTDGTLWSWGLNNRGQLGNETTSYYSSPIQIGSLTNWKQVAGGQDHIAAIKTDGTLWTWGRNQSGALGNGTIIDYSSPIQVGSLTNWKLVSTGIASSAAIKTDGTLWTWGRNDRGQLGNGTTISYSSPIQIGSLTNWKQVAIYFNSAAVKTDGTLWTWGNNQNGGLGNSTIVYYSSPIQIGSLNIWKQVTCGGNFFSTTTMAIQSSDYY